MTTGKEARTVLVLCTAPPDVAPALVDALLNERLIACANLVGPLSSRYRWEGRIEHSEETLIVIKADHEVTARLRERLVELHPYDVPEVLEFPATGGFGPYLDWVRASCRGSDSS